MQPTIVLEHTSASNVSRQRLVTLHNEMRRWRLLDSPVGTSNRTRHIANIDSSTLASSLSTLTTQLMVGSWYADDLEAAKTTLVELLVALLQKTEHTRSDRLVAHVAIGALARHVWWPRLLIDETHQYALTYALLSAQTSENPAHATGPAREISRQWLQQQQPQPFLQQLRARIKAVLGSAPATRDQPLFETRAHIAERLLGPAWLSLYGDLLDNPTELGTHLREVRPPFVWDVPRKTVALTGTALLPTDLSL